jgi:hypothetical protein
LLFKLRLGSTKSSPTITQLIALDLSADRQAFYFLSLGSAQLITFYFLLFTRLTD